MLVVFEALNNVVLVVVVGDWMDGRMTVANVVAAVAAVVE